MVKLVGVYSTIIVARWGVSSQNLERGYPSTHTCSCSARQRQDAPRQSLPPINRETCILAVRIPAGFRRRSPRNPRQEIAAQMDRQEEEDDDAALREAGGGASFPGGWLRRLSRELHWSFVLAVVAVYGACQGVGDAVGGVTAGYYWKDVQRVQPSAAQFYQGFVSAPWVVKPIWGLLTDVVPVAGYRRRPYFLLPVRGLQPPPPRSHLAVRRLSPYLITSLGDSFRSDWGVVHAHALSPPQAGHHAGDLGADGAERGRGGGRRDGGRAGCSEQHHAPAASRRHAEPVWVQLLRWGIAWILHQRSSCPLHRVSGVIFPDLR